MSSGQPTAHRAFQCCAAAMVAIQAPGTALPAHHLSNTASHEMVRMDIPALAYKFCYSGP